MKAKFIVFLVRVFATLPLSLLQKLGELAASICWLKSARIVDITRINLRLCFPSLTDSEREVLAKSSVQETMITIAQAGTIWLKPANKVLKQVVKVEGLELFHAAHAEGKGVIIISPHLGNWELLGLYLGSSGLDQVSFLYQPLKDPELDQLIKQARSRGRSKLVPTTTKGVATILAALRNGELVGILPDQVPVQASGEYTEFFGVDAYTMTLISRLLNKTGAKAIFACAYRLSDLKGNKYKVVFQEPPQQIYAKHMPNSLIALNLGIEALVKAAPEQYQWEYKRFKMQPDGKKLYEL